MMDVREIAKNIFLRVFQSNTLIEDAVSKYSRKLNKIAFKFFS